MNNISERMSEIEARLKVVGLNRWYRGSNNVAGEPTVIADHGYMICTVAHECVRPKEELDALTDLIVHAPADIRWLLDEVRKARSERLEAAHDNNVLRSEIAILKVENNKALRQALSLMTHVLELARALRDAAIGVEGWQVKHASTLEAVKRVLGV